MFFITVRLFSPFGCVISPGGCVNAVNGCVIPSGGCVNAVKRCVIPPNGCVIAVNGCVIPSGGCVIALSGCNFPPAGCDFHRRDEIFIQSMRFVYFFDHFLIILSKSIIRMAAESRFCRYSPLPVRAVASKHTVSRFVVYYSPAPV